MYVEIPQAAPSLLEKAHEQFVSFLDRIVHPKAKQYFFNEIMPENGKWYVHYCAEGEQDDPRTMYFEILIPEGYLAAFTIERKLREWTEIDENGDYRGKVHVTPFEEWMDVWVNKCEAVTKYINSGGYYEIDGDNVNLRIEHLSNKSIEFKHAWPK